MSRSSPGVRLAVVIAVGVTLILAAYFYQRPAEDPVRGGDILPPGRWHFQASRLADEVDGEELARVLSLPYVSGSTAASGRDGVIRYESERTFDGLNLYVSGHGPEALLVDMKGNPVHRWQCPFETAFPNKEPSAETTFFRRAFVYPNGDLLVLFQGGGIVKLDRDSKILWTSDLPAYNHLFVDDKGQILTIAKIARMIPDLRPDGPILEDFIVFLTADGEIERRFSLLESFRASALAETIHPLPDHADIFHTNTVIAIDDAVAESSDLFRPGMLLVSLRDIDTVALIDPVSTTVEMAWRGPWRAQHQPVPLSTGSVLLFDNQGAEGGSRVVEFDPNTGELAWIFPQQAAATLWSAEAGSCQRLPNGNTLITESEMGRAIEITPDRAVVWEFSSPHRAGEKLEMVATLFEVVRLPAEALTFVDSNGTPQKKR
jgi:hypothetical protein